MMRANEESTTKSVRLKAAWAARRDAPGSCFHGLQCPGWIVGKADRTGYELIPEKAAVLRRIFREALAGDGVQTISRRLNDEGVPLFGRGNQRGKLWQRSLVRHLIYSDLCIGTYTPCHAMIVNGKARYMPLLPKLAYYPAVVSVAEIDWETLRRRRLAWSEYHKCTEKRDLTLVANVLSRLARCPKCDRAMVLTRTQDPNQRYLLCMGWREARVCSNEWVRYPEIEDVFVSDVRFLMRDCPQPVLHVETRRAMLKSITNRLAHLRSRMADESAAHPTLSRIARAGRSWVADTKGEMDQLTSERYRLRADRNYWTDATLKLKLESLGSAVAAQPRDLARINAALRALLTKVVIDWENARLILHWRHGGESTKEFWRKRQRGGSRNVTPVGGRKPAARLLPAPLVG